ncbi:hypothetical protein MTO96_003141 [Rhipicephalus appendiculatus]
MNRHYRGECASLFSERASERSHQSRRAEQLHERAEESPNGRDSGSSGTVGKNLCARRAQRWDAAPPRTAAAAHHRASYAVSRRRRTPHSLAKGHESTPGDGDDPRSNEGVLGAL